MIPSLPDSHGQRLAGSDEAPAAPVPTALAVRPPTEPLALDRYYAIIRAQITQPNVKGKIDRSECNA